MTDPSDEYRARQRSRAKVMAFLLGAVVVLLFFLTLAKIGQPGV